MRKLGKIFIISIFVVFAFAGCRNNNYPWGMLPPYDTGDNQVSQEEAAIIIGSYIDEISFNNIKDVASELFSSYLNDFLYTPGNLDQLLASYDTDGNGSIDNGESAAILGLFSDPEELSEFIAKAINGGYLYKPEGTYNSYGLKLNNIDIDNDKLLLICQGLLEKDHTNPAEEGLVNVDDSKYPFEVPATITATVTNSKMDSSIFDTGSEYAYEGDIEITVDVTIINTKTHGDIKISIDRVSVSTPSKLSAKSSSSDSIHTFRFVNVSANLGWMIGEGNTTLPSSFPFTPLDGGIVYYDGTAVPFLAAVEHSDQANRI